MLVTYIFLELGVAACLDSIEHKVSGPYVDTFSFAPTSLKT